MGSGWMVILAFVLFKILRTGLLAIVIWLALPAIFGMDKRTAKQAAILTAVVLFIYDIGMIAIRFFS